LTYKVITTYQQIDYSMVLLTFVDNNCFCCYLFNWFYSEINFYSI